MVKIYSCYVFPPSLALHPSKNAMQAAQWIWLIFINFFSSGILVSSKQTTLPQGEDLTPSLVITVEKKIIGTIQIVRQMDGD